MSNKRQKRNKKKFDNIDKFESKRIKGLRKLNKKHHNNGHDYYHDDYDVLVDDQYNLETQQILEQCDAIEVDNKEK